LQALMRMLKEAMIIAKSVFFILIEFEVRKILSITSTTS
jgi:hypothetical protein